MFQLKEFITDEELAQIEGQETPEFIPEEPISDEIPEETGGFLDAAEKVGNFFRKVPSGLSKVGGALGLGGLGKGIAQSIFQFTPEGKDVLKMLGEGEITQEQFDEIVGGGLVTPKEVLASAGQTALLAGSSAFGAMTALGRIGVSAGLGGAFGGLSAIEKDKSWTDVLKSTAIGAGVGGAVGGVLESGRILATKMFPKLLNYTSRTPDRAIERNIKYPSRMGSSMKRVKGVESEAVLGEVQKAVVNSRKNLSLEWKEGEKYLTQQFHKQRFGLNTKEIGQLQKIADDFAFDIPDNLENMSIKEWLNLNKGLNELSRKTGVKAAPKGHIVREVSDTIKTKLLKFFGGKE